MLSRDFPCGSAWNRSSQEFAEEIAGSPKFLGNLDYPFAHVPNRRRQDCLHQTIRGQQRGPWHAKSKGSHNWGFRRSIAWLSDSLSTLRRGRYLLDARLASSCWSGSNGRGSHPQGSTGRFQITSHPPFPGLLGAIATPDAARACSKLAEGVPNRTRSISAPSAAARRETAARRGLVALGCDLVAGRSHFGVVTKIWAPTAQPQNAGRPAKPARTLKPQATKRRIACKPPPWADMHFEASH